MYIFCNLWCVTVVAEIYSYIMRKFKLCRVYEVPYQSPDFRYFFLEIRGSLLRFTFLDSSQKAGPLISKVIPQTANPLIFTVKHLHIPLTFLLTSSNFS